MAGAGSPAQPRCHERPDARGEPDQSAFGPTTIFAAASFFRQSASSAASVAGPGVFGPGDVLRPGGGVGHPPVVAAAGLDPSDQVGATAVLEEGPRTAAVVHVPDIRAHVLGRDDPAVGQTAGGDDPIAGELDVMARGDGDAVVRRGHDLILHRDDESGGLGGSVRRAVAKHQTAAGVSPSRSPRSSRRCSPARAGW